MPGATFPLNIGWNDKEMRLDYGARTDGQPVYQGFAPSGIGTADAFWTLYAFTYDGSNFVTRRQIKHRAVWDNRSTELTP